VKGATTKSWKTRVCETDHQETPHPDKLLREHEPRTYRFKDDGLIPNHPTWPLVIYKIAVRSPARSIPQPC
jgi:hypothetical protein